MNSANKLLVQTLVQRGESDNYIRDRLLTIGLPESEAKQLIHDSRVNSHIIISYPTVTLETTLLVLGSLGIMLLLVWSLLSGTLF